MRFSRELEVAAACLPLRLRRSLMYAGAHKRALSLRHPQRFTEKINWRIVHDRRDIIRPLGDKMAMKEYASSRRAGVNIPQTLWSGTTIEDFLATAPSGPWVVKPNHRSGLVVFGSDGNLEDPGVVVSNDWLQERNGRYKGEWAYQSARRCLIAEPNISPDGSIPMDYKFYVFRGDIPVIHVDADRFGSITRNFYTPEWKPIQVSNGFPSSDHISAPKNLPAMLEAASTLGACFDFMRVDLYSDGTDIWFGEFTPYPAGGLRSYSPDQFDLWLGSHWQLPTL